MPASCISCSAFAHPRHAIRFQPLPRSVRPVKYWIDTEFIAKRSPSISSASALSPRTGGSFIRRAAKASPGTLELEIEDREVDARRAGACVKPWRCGQDVSGQGSFRPLPGGGAIAAKGQQSVEDDAALVRISDLDLRPLDECAHFVNAARHDEPCAGRLGSFLQFRSAGAGCARPSPTTNGHDAIFTA